MSVASTLSPHEMPENSLGSERVPAETIDLGQERTKISAIFGGEVAVNREAQGPAHEVTSPQAQYTDEVLVAPVATVEMPRKAEPIPTSAEAVQRVTDNASVAMNERLTQVAIDLERGGYGLAA